MIYICLVKNVVVLKSGLESFWIPYQKDTGKGIRTVVRKSHSAQSSANLLQWHKQFADAASKGQVMKKARENCIAAAQKAIAGKTGDEETRAAMRFFRTYDKNKIENSVCKMSAIRPFLSKALESVAKKYNRAHVSAAAAQGAAGEIEGLEL
jgi:hypothetical protein